MPADQPSDSSVAASGSESNPPDPSSQFPSIGPSASSSSNVPTAAASDPLPEGLPTCFKSFKIVRFAGGELMPGMEVLHEQLQLTVTYGHVDRFGNYKQYSRVFTGCTVTEVFAAIAQWNNDGPTQPQKSALQSIFVKEVGKGYADPYIES